MSSPEATLYKEYIQRLRRIELEEVHLNVVSDVSPQLKKILKRILNTEFRDGWVHSYYGKIKDTIIAFNNFWSEIIEESIVNTDKNSNVYKEDALNLIETSISQQVVKQVDFGKEYIPVRSVDEKQLYEMIEAKYHTYMQELYKIKEEVDEIAVRHFPATVIADRVKIATQKLGEMFRFTHKYIALVLADNLYRIRSSLEDILVRTRQNLKQLKAERDEDANELVQELYEYHKRLMELERRNPTNQLALSDLKKQVAAASSRLEAHQLHKGRSIELVKEELQMWTDQINNFEPIARVLRALKAEIDSTQQQEKQYSEKRCLDLPGTKTENWKLIGENLQKRKEYLNRKVVEAAKTLVTFFTVQGPAAELYNDPDIGPFFYDEYGHQVYRLEYGLRPCHITCEWSLIEIPKHEDLFAYDEMGQYRMEGERKIYQRSNCGSCYELNADDELFKRISADCAHSTAVDAHCTSNIRHISPARAEETAADYSYKGKLDPETTQYIWETFGHILPEALAEVAAAKPENPLKYLGNRLLKLQHSWTKKELETKKKAAAKFRDDILNGRKQKLVDATLAWRAKFREHGKQSFHEDETMLHLQERAMRLWHINNLL